MVQWLKVCLLMQGTWVLSRRPLASDQPATSLGRAGDGARWLFFLSGAGAGGGPQPRAGGSPAGTSIAVSLGLNERRAWPGPARPPRPGGGSWRRSGRWGRGSSRPTSAPGLRSGPDTRRTVSPLLWARRERPDRLQAPRLRLRLRPAPAPSASPRPRSVPGPRQPARRSLSRAPSPAAARAPAPPGAARPPRSPASSPPRRLGSGTRGSANKRRTRRERQGGTQAASEGGICEATATPSRVRPAEAAEAPAPSASVPPPCPPLLAWATPPAEAPPLPSSAQRSRERRDGGLPGRGRADLRSREPASIYTPSTSPLAAVRSVRELRPPEPGRERQIIPMYRCVN